MARTESSRPSDPRSLVLVGGGHAHVQVLRRFAMRPEPGLRLVVVLDRSEAIYSGMVPGFVAGDYQHHELAIDVVPLARRAGAALILSPALSVDPLTKTIELRDRPAIRYDLASLDVGSTVRGLDAPGVREHALGTRPIASFVEALDARLGSVPGEADIVVVGGGAAGIELCFTVRARLEAAGVHAKLRLLTESDSVLPGYPEPVQQRMLAIAHRDGIAVSTRSRVLAVEADVVVTEEGRTPSDLTIWATGAAPLPWLEASPLPTDEAGFVRVTPTLQVEGHPDLFAVGDCAQLIDAPWVPKAGVYAVREGPYLAKNLRSRFNERKLEAYKPQADFLSLLHLGSGRALASKWGRVSVGRGAFRLKRWIDRRFMSRFQILGPDGTPTRALPSPEEMGMEEMECGGCAAKLGGNALERALDRLPTPPADPSVLLGVGDDAALVKSEGGGETLLTVDAFRAFSDDPWLVGRVAAVNALSDIYACGGRPRHALASVQVAERDGGRAEETLWQTLSGIRAALDPLGVSLVGGHTTHGDELAVGLSVVGEPEPGNALAKGGLRPGDALILTKALGTGVLLAADMRGLARGDWLEAAIAGMLRPNADAAGVARSFSVSAATDVTGFGLAVHLGEMLVAAGMGARLRGATLPRLPGAETLLARGERSTFHPQNEARAQQLVGLEPAGAPAIVFDPQTSGGLLLALPTPRAQACVEALREAGDRGATIIGETLEAPQRGPRLVVT